MIKWLLVFLIPIAIAQEGQPPVEEGGKEASKEEDDGNPWREIEMPYTKQNVMVPRELWRVINELLEADDIPEEVKNNYAIYPATMTVEIVHEDQGVTKKNKNYRVTFLEGGGEIDLFNFIDGKGKFYVRLSPHIMNDANFHLLYMSESPGRLYGDTQWGNGCGNIFDLSEKANMFLADKGVLVTTSKRHYLHLLAGYYIVFQLVEDKMLLGYIRVKDSRYPQFSCTL